MQYFIRCAQELVILLSVCLYQIDRNFVEIQDWHSLHYMNGIQGEIVKRTVLNLVANPSQNTTMGKSTSYTAWNICSKRPYMSLLLTRLQIPRSKGSKSYKSRYTVQQSRLHATLQSKYVSWILIDKQSKICLWYISGLNQCWEGKVLDTMDCYGTRCMVDMGQLYCTSYRWLSWLCHTDAFDQINLNAQGQKTSDLHYAGMS